ncbi:MAG: hypothetical protein U9R56_07955 [candidate division Zixibacteria bacterium]|nr:hypothetical protein [candidate division Zixibacteria bacterium]
MDFKELAKLIFENLKPVLETHSGLRIYVRERGKFEGWLKVELCRVLSENGIDPEPESARWDVSFEKWGIELRTVTTNVSHDNVKNIKRSTTRNVEALIKDIWKLITPGRTITFPNRAILFIVYPLDHEDPHWQTNHLRQITSELADLEYLSFHFAGNVPGVLYFGLCAGSH